MVWYWCGGVVLCVHSVDLGYGAGGLGCGLLSHVFRCCVCVMLRVLGVSLGLFFFKAEEGYGVTWWMEFKSGLIKHHHISRRHSTTCKFSPTEFLYNPSECGIDSNTFGSRQSVAYPAIQ